MENTKSLTHPPLSYHPSMYVSIHQELEVVPGIVPTLINTASIYADPYLSLLLLEVQPPAY